MTISIRGRLAAVIAVGVLALASCASGPPDWNAYPAYVQDAVDRAITSQDCSMLQSQFDGADRKGWTDLMVYLDGQMRDVGCHG